MAMLIHLSGYSCVCRLGVGCTYISCPAWVIACLVTVYKTPAWSCSILHPSVGNQILLRRIDCVNATVSEPYTLSSDIPACNPCQHNIGMDSAVLDSRFPFHTLTPITPIFLGNQPVSVYDIDTRGDARFRNPRSTLCRISLSPHHLFSLRTQLPFPSPYFFPS